MTSTAKHTVLKTDKNIRLCDYLIDIFPPIASKSAIKKAIKRKEIWIDGRPGETATWVKEGQMIEYRPVQANTKVYQLKIPVIFEDEYIAVIDKPAGLGVSGNYFKTVQNALPYNLENSTEADALRMPRPVHRLDRETQGLLLVAKTHTAMTRLQRQFSDKDITKQYHAILKGTLKNELRIETMIDHKNALSVITPLRYRVHSIYGNLTLTRLEPVTGRTHQLRIHSAEISNGILGDKLYGVKINQEPSSLFLCANELSLYHPITEEKLQLTINLPKCFQDFIE